MGQPRRKRRLPRKEPLTFGLLEKRHTVVLSVALIAFGLFLFVWGLNYSMGEMGAPAKPLMPNKDFFN